jgi:hypothetical protein
MANFSDSPDTDKDDGILDILLMGLRLPGRLAGDLESVSRTVRSLLRTADVHLASIDERAGDLVTGLCGLQASVLRVETKVERLTGLEATIEGRMEVLRADLNTRMLAVEAEVRQIHPGIDQIAHDVQTISRLLPDPSDGPLTRLKDTLTSS